MLRVELRELEECVDVVRVPDDVVLPLHGVILLGGLEPDGVVGALHLKFLPNLEEFAHSRR
jgi:hypothetical protein